MNKSWRWHMCYRNTTGLRSRWFWYIANRSICEIDAPCSVFDLYKKNDVAFLMVFTWLWGRQIVFLLGTIIKFQRTRFFLGFFWWLRTWKPIRPGYITCLGMCKVCTEAVHSVALWTRVTLHVWACVKYVPKQSIPKHFEHGLHYMFGHV